MARCSFGFERLVATQNDAWMAPKTWRGDASLPLVCYCHGGGQTAIGVLDAPGNPFALGVFLAVANRFPMISIDGGTKNQGGTSDSDNWGNDNAITLTHTAITAAKTALGTKAGPVLLVGSSMGTVTALNYYKAHPTNVAAIATFLSLTDMDDVRDNNRLSQRAGISNAWGTGAWTAPGTPALPAGANPADNTSSFTGVPILMYYSSGDTVALPGPVTAFAAAVGSNVTAVQAGSNDHSDAASGDIPQADLIAFLASHA